MTIKIINKSKHQLPHYETSSSAGMDIRADIDKTILLKPREITVVKTVLVIALVKSSEAQV